jgi:hypothetical protein
MLSNFVITPVQELTYYYSAACNNPHNMLYGTCDFAVHESTTFGTTITKGMGKSRE